MVSGISRFTKGKFNNGAIDEVYSKAKELWQEVTPPSSGVTPMTSDVIWNDSYYPPQQFPCGHNEWGYEYLMRDEIPSPSFQPVSSGDPDWTASNVYWEVCNRAVGDNSCAYSQNEVTNTYVEIDGCSHYILREGATSWETVMEGAHPKYGHGQTNPPSGAPYKLCTDPDIMAWMDSDRGSQIFYPVDGIDYYLPVGGGAFPHPWTEKVIIAGGTSDIIAVCVQMYARLVQRDMSKPNDFHLAEFVSYTGTDAKNAAGSNVWRIAVQGHFRSIDKSGDWSPFGVVAGIADLATFEANLPPMPSTP